VPSAQSKGVTTLESCGWEVTQKWDQRKKRKERGNQRSNKGVGLIREGHFIKERRIGGGGKGIGENPCLKPKLEKKVTVTT